MRDRMKLALYQIHYPEGLVDLKRVSDGSYTWGTGESYQQIKHHVKLVNQTLKIESLRKQLRDLGRHVNRNDWELTWEFEQYQRVRNELELYEQVDVGGVVNWSGVFAVPDDNDLPSVVRQLRLEQKRQHDADVQAESRMTCISCSL